MYNHTHRKLHQFSQPIITLSTATVETEQDYFCHSSTIISTPIDSAIYNKESNSSVHDNYENDSPNIYHQYPVSKQLIDQKVHSVPLLHHQRLVPPPPSILQKNVNSSSTISKQIFIKSDGDDEEERRPSVITFANSDTHTIFYDASSEIDDGNYKDGTLVQQHNNNNNKRSSSSKPKIMNWKNKRPSAMSRISSTYTNKTAAISIDYIDLEPSRYLHEGILLCAFVPLHQKKMEEHQKYHHNDCYKIPLQWKEYRAVITQSGHLELYNYCRCKNNLLHMCFHYHYKKPQHIIDLHPSVHNPLFRKVALVNHKSTEAFPCYRLSLISPIDFSWSLSSVNTTFYFQSNSLRFSQYWYRMLYTILPFKSKKSLPQCVDLMVPELSTCIRLPISELIKEEDENVDLRKVRESALVLLHRNGNRPPHWTKRTIGLCWKLIHGNSDQLDWVLKPSDDDNHSVYLIEPRLIEKTHELQLRYWQDENKEAEKEERPAVMKGYLIDKKKKKNFRLYAVTMDHYLFLYEDKLQIMSEPPTSSLRCCINRKRYNQTYPNEIDEPSSIQSAIGVIDLLKIKHITEEPMPQQNELEEKPQQLLHPDDRYLFQIIHQPINDWTIGLASIQNYYTNTSRRTGQQQQNEIMQSGEIYIKSTTNGQFKTFRHRLFILTKKGDMCIFKSSPKSSYKVPFYSFSLTKIRQDAEEKESIYVYSGEECCSYIAGLPLRWSSRIFENGVVVENRDQNKPRQCCFVIHYKKKDHVFLTRSQDEKEAWVQSIFSFL